MSERAAVNATDRSDILTVGFGTTVAMWAAAYVCRFPPAVVPSQVLLFLMLACLVSGGVVIGRYSQRGAGGGAAAGAVAGLLNLLILGSLLTSTAPNQVLPSALWWVPGSILAGAALGAIGAAIGRGTRGPATAARNWTGGFALVTATATLLLLIAGGIVTSADAGLAVVDWPNSFGSNMFLYPLSKMTGGIYYEHAHRLLGTLVGLSTLVLAVRIQRRESRRWLRRLAWFTFGLVCVQGILGGLRVTGTFTLSTRHQDMAPSLTLAIIHGVVGQCIFGLIVAIAVFLSSSWHRAHDATPADYASTDQGLGVAVIALVVVQLVLGAIQRHLAEGLLIHVTTAVIVVLVAVTAGVRAWGLNEGQPLLQRAGVWLVVVMTVQVALGLAAVWTTGPRSPESPASGAQVAIATAHQAVGALLLASAVVLTLWTYRLLRQPALDAAS